MSRQPSPDLEPRLTREELFGWLHRMYQRYEDRLAQAEQPQDEEQPCDGSTVSE